MDKRDPRSRWIGRAWRRLVRVSQPFLFVHNLVQALPWLLGTVFAVVIGAYGWIDSHAVVFAFAAGLASACLIVLAIGFSAWFLERRRVGWRRRAEERKVIAARRDDERRAANRELAVEREHGARMALALDLIKGLSLLPLTISDAAHADEETRAWIANRLMPVMDKLMPRGRLGLGLLAWRDGTYGLICDVGVPEIVRAILPKRTSRHLSLCIERLGITGDVHFVALSEDMMSPGGQEWLLAFPQGGEFDEASEAVLAVGARIIADARRGGDGDSSDRLPA